MSTFVTVTRILSDGTGKMPVRVNLDTVTTLFQPIGEDEVKIAKTQMVFIDGAVMLATETVAAVLAQAGVK